MQNKTDLRTGYLHDVYTCMSVYTWWSVYRQVISCDITDRIYQEYYTIYKLLLTTAVECYGSHENITNYIIQHSKLEAIMMEALPETWYNLQLANPDFEY